MFSIGTRFNDRVTGKLSEFAPNAKIIHIDIDSAPISRNIVVDIPIVADAKSAIIEMIPFSKKYNTDKWLDEIKIWDKEHPLKIDTSFKNTISPQFIIEKVNESFPDAIIVTDVGQHQMWTAQYIEMNENKKLITSGGLGTMGFGLPAAIGAQLGNPYKKVVCICGDGGFQMNIQEMATAAQHELPITIIIINNSFLGMVREMQHFFYNKKYSDTCLRKRKSCSDKCQFENRNIPDSCPPYTPDFIKLAESYGAYGIRVDKKENITSAFEKAKTNKDAPTIIEILIDFKENVLPIVQCGKSLKDMIISDK